MNSSRAISAIFRRFASPLCRQAWFWPWSRRLAILTVLASCESADFTFLETATGLTKGNLSVQLTRLEEASLICIKKVTKKNRTITTAHILAAGRDELARYWRQMEEIRDAR